MIWEKLDMWLKFEPKKLKVSTSTGALFPAHLKWNTIPEYPDFEAHRWHYDVRKRKADGKIGKVYSVKPWDRKFGEPRWKFRKFGAKPVTTFRDGWTFGDKLLKRGFVKLGSGAYSAVYGKPGSNRVIKVTSSEDNWIDYVQWAAKKGYAGKYAPQVFSYKKITGMKQDFSVSVMERMDKTIRDIDNGHNYRMLSGMMHYAAKGNDLAKEMLDKVTPGLAQFANDLYTEFGDEDRFDLHDGNFMVRFDGSFALTDPVCGSSKLTVTRLRAGDFTPALVNLLREFIESSFRHRGGWTEAY